MQNYQDSNICQSYFKKRNVLENDEQLLNLINPKRVIKYDRDILRKSNQIYYENQIKKDKKYLKALIVKRESIKLLDDLIKK